MEYQLIHQDAAGAKISSTGRISLLAFAKHATFAGINHRFFAQLPFRYASLFLEFAPSFWWPGHFSVLPELSSDPTEIAYISNRVGRAFADYFSKKIYGARFTHSYECAMVEKGFPISGERPDFYCDTLARQFAVEAKGYSAQSISDNQMVNHKDQSKKGPLPVHFSVASVSYNLYKSPKIKFYDPEDDNVPYDKETNTKLRKMYYESIFHFAESVADRRTQSEISDYFAYNFYSPFSSVRQILLHKVIVEKSWETTEWLSSIQYRDTEDEDIYIDVDGVGLTTRSTRTR